MPPFVAPLVIISAACLAILVILYRIYETRVEQPKKLEDEVKEALGGIRPDVESIEPVRHAAAAISYSANKIVIVREFGKKPTRVYSIAELFGMEVFADGKIFARVVRAGSNKPLDTGSYKAIDDISPQVTVVTMRLIFDDPTHPEYELDLWTPRDALTARAEGPHAAMVTARKWFHHIEAILRRPVPEVPRAVPPVNPVAPEPLKVAAPVAAPSPDRPAPPPRADGDVLNSPLIPYL